MGWRGRDCDRLKKGRGGVEGKGLQQTKEGWGRWRDCDRLKKGRGGAGETD